MRWPRRSPTRPARSPARPPTCATTPTPDPRGRSGHFGPSWSAAADAVVAVERDQALVRVIDDGLRIPGGDAAGCGPGLVDVRRVEAAQLRHPPPHVGAVGVELLALRDRVEDSVVRRGVRARAGDPLPAVVVAGQV